MKNSLFSQTGTTILTVKVHKIPAALHFISIYNQSFMIIDFAVEESFQ